MYKNIYYEFRNFIDSKNNTDVNAKPSLIYYIEKETPVISFNYTDLIKMYSKNVDYIHGSIAENFIVFGYSRRIEYDYIDPKSAVYAKQKLRDLLHYARFLMKNYDVDNSGLKSYTDEYQPHLLQSYTGKGGLLIEYPDEFVERCNRYLQNNTDYYDFFIESHPYISEELHDEARRYRLGIMSEPLNDYFENQFLTEDGFRAVPLLSISVDYNKVNQLVIVGHGLESDTEIFEEIFSRLPHLKEVVLFIYKDEQESDIERKKQIISQWTDCPFILKEY